MNRKMKKFVPNSKKNSRIGPLRMMISKNTKYGNPAEAVNYFKQEHFRKATQLYIHMNKLDSNFIRFDVIEIIYGNKKTKINHIKQAIDY